MVCLNWIFPSQLLLWSQGCIPMGIKRKSSKDSIRTFWWTCGWNGGQLPRPCRTVVPLSGSRLLCYDFSTPHSQLSPRLSSSPLLPLGWYVCAWYWRNNCTASPKTLGVFWLDVHVTFVFRFDIILLVIVLCACLSSLGLSVMRALSSYQKTQFHKWQVISLTLAPGWFDLGHQGELLSFGRTACTQDTRRSKNFETPAGIKEGGKGYWQRYNCFRNISALVSMQETCNTNSFKSLGQQSHILSSQFITPTLSRTLLWLREGVLLIQTLLQPFLKRGKRFHKCFPLVYCCYHFPPDYSHSQPMWKIKRLFKIKWWWFWAERT